MERRIPAHIASIIVLSACGGEVVPDAAPDSSVPTLDASAPDVGTERGTDGGVFQDSITSFEAFKRIIFEPHCAGCHYPTNGFRFGLSREDLLAARNQLVDMAYVSPGDPNRSYLVHKLEDTQAGLCEARGIRALYCGSQMPLPAGGALSPEEIEAVRQWVSNGAP